MSLEELGVDAGTERIHDLNELPGALRGDLVGGGVFGPRFLVSEHVPLLVEDSLQVALLAVAEHKAPVGAFITSDRGTGGELDLWYNHTAWLMMSGRKADAEGSGIDAFASRHCAARRVNLTMPVEGSAMMPNRFKTATGLVLVLVLAGVAVSPHAQTAGSAYRLTVTIDGFSKSCGEVLGPEYYVTVTRLDLEVQDQIADVNREAAQIAGLGPGFGVGAADHSMESLRARDLNSELDPLSETERRSLERLRGVRSSDRTDDERREFEALESRETLSSAESRKLQRMEELVKRWARAEAPNSNDDKSRESRLLARASER